MPSNKNLYNSELSSEVKQILKTRVKRYLAGDAKLYSYEEVKKMLTAKFQD